LSAPGGPRLFQSGIIHQKQAFLINSQHGRTMRNWTDSSTFGVVGCFFVFLLLMIAAGWITLRIMEAMSPA